MDTPEDPNAEKPSASLSSEEMSRVGLKAVLKIADAWELGEEETRGILGNPPDEAYQRWQQGHYDVLSPEMLLRISLLIHIYYRTHMLLPAVQADTWIKRSNQVFHEASALDIMLTDGIDGLRRVHEHLSTSRC